VAFTLFSWLSACAFVIVVTTVVGAVLADDPGRLGRFIRTPNVGTSSSPGDANRSVGEIPVPNLATVELEPPVDRDMRRA
jgi:hypothetical protein